MAQARPPADDHVPSSPSDAAAIRFPSDGALDLAHALRGLADATDEARAGRGRAGDRVLAAGAGPAAGELARRLEAEAAAMADAAVALRRDAAAWAGASAGAAEDLGRPLGPAGAVVGAPEPATAPVVAPRPPAVEGTGHAPGGPVGRAPSSGAGR